MRTSSGQLLNLTGIRFSVWAGWSADETIKRWEGAFADQFLVVGSWPNEPLPRNYDIRASVRFNDDGETVVDDWLSGYVRRHLSSAIRLQYGIADQYRVQIDAAQIVARKVVN